MDPHQPGSKRGIEEISIHNQDDGMPSTSEGGEGAEVKRFKQELHPLQMGAVLEQIFSNLDPDSIKNARQVNRLWSVEGAKILIIKCYVKIPSDIQDGKFVSRLKALEKFIGFLSHKSTTFSTISKITVDEVADVELWEYLGVGQQVKSLKISNIPGENETKFFKKLLDMLPNLNYIRFEEVKLVSTIIKALTTVMMSTPKKDHNSMNISFLSLYPQDVEELEDIEKFASCKNIMIEKLKIEMDPDFSEGARRFANAVSTILSTNQNILTTLILVDCNPILPLLEFPCMPTLTQFALNFNSETAGQLSSLFSSFRFSEKVPNLQDLRIIEPLSDDPPVSGQIVRRCFTNLFQRAGVAPSVKKVSCWGNVSDFDVYHLFKTFPNIQEFGTDLNWNSDAMLRSVWKHGANLKELYLYLDLYPPLEKVDDLDSSFTGLPFWAVEEIKKAPNLDAFTLEEVKKLRIDSSMLNLKGLERLEIHFRGRWRKDRPKRMLAVAGEFAFKSMPKNSEIIINVEKFEGSMDLDDISKLPNVEIES